MFHWLTQRRRRHLLEQPFPADWDAILDRNVTMLHRLDPALRRRHRDLTQVLIAEKNWEGCGGLELTDEHRVTVAAQACVLLVGSNEHDLFAECQSVLVYPSTVLTPKRGTSVFERRPVMPGVQQPIIGEATRTGAVVIAWDRALRGGRDEDGPHNVVLHEFAHEIDMHDGPVDGTPPLSDRTDLRAWVATCEPAFLALREAVERGEPTFLDAYGATNEGEFFAVATEAYFTRPREMAEAMPALFRLLRAFYRVALSPRTANG